MSSLKAIAAIAESAWRDLAAVSGEQALEAWRIAYLGRKGSLTVV